MSMTQHRVYNVFFHCYGDHQNLHSFPTRRSSDLDPVRGYVGLCGHPVCDAASFDVRDYQLHIRIIQADKDRKSTRLNSSHSQISYAVFCLKKKNTYVSAHTICASVSGCVCMAVSC